MLTIRTSSAMSAAIPSCVECEQENVVNVDGEAIRTTDAQIELIPQAIRFFYPRGLTYRCENSQK